MYFSHKPFNKEHEEKRKYKSGLRACMVCQRTFPIKNLPVQNLSSGPHYHGRETFIYFATFGVKHHVGY
jgi:hypothetical protein